MDAKAGASAEKEKSSRARAGKIAGIVSAFLWIAGIALAFVITPSSPYIWVPDALLLLGFVPLLFFWSPSWPWIIFGLFNAAIGFLLQTIEYLPDSQFPSDLVKAKTHLAQYHEPNTWMIIGFFSTAYGLGRLMKNIICWCLRKHRQARKRDGAAP